MPTNVYILLDRSGSMEGRWVEALSTINGYVEGLAKAGHEGAVTCAVFDGFTTPPGYTRGGWVAGASGDKFQFDTLRLGTRPQDWKPITREDAVPRGDTPLYDAIGRLCSLADADPNPKGLLLLMTDGQENASRELTRQGATAALDRQRARGWEVIHLGVNFTEVVAQAASLGTLSMKSANLGSQAMQSGAAAEYLSNSTRAYATGGVALNMSDEDKKKLGA
jgi:hypothetical protein